VKLKLTLACVLSLNAMSASAFAAELKVLSVGTVGAVLREVTPGFERESGNRVQMTFGNPAAIVDRLRQGEATDIAIVATAIWEQAEAVGRFNLETKTELPSTLFGIAAKVGTRQPGAVTLQGFLSIVGEVSSIGLVDRSPATPLMLQNLGKHGVASQFEAKTKLYATGEVVADAVSHGQVDLGITTLSELVSKAGVVVLSTVPAEILAITVRTTAVVTKDASASHEARAYLQFLRSPAVISVFRARGFFPS
jgi:molybdate transport system substrate-binding protein